MGVWDRIKKSISPGDDDDNTYDDDELFDDDYDTGDGYSDSGGINDNMSGGGFSQPNPYAPSTPANNYSNNNNYQPPAHNNAAPPPTTAVTSISGGDLSSATEIIIVKPDHFIDGSRIADLLMGGKTVVIDFEDTNKEVIRKILDFTAGVVYATNSSIKKVRERNYIASPPTMRVTHDPRKAERERNGERNDMGGRDPSIY